MPSCFLSSLVPRSTPAGLPHALGHRAAFATSAFEPSPPPPRPFRPGRRAPVLARDLDAGLPLSSPHCDIDVCGRWCHPVCFAISKEGVPEELPCCMHAPGKHPRFDPLPPTDTLPPRSADAPRPALAPFIDDLGDERTQFVSTKDDVVPLAPHAATQHKVHAYPAHLPSVSALGPTLPLHTLDAALANSTWNSGRRRRAGSLLAALGPHLGGRVRLSSPKLGHRCALTLDAELPCSCSRKHHAEPATSPLSTPAQCSARRLDSDLRDVRHSGNSTPVLSPQRHSVTHDPEFTSRSGSLAQRPASKVESTEILSPLTDTLRPEEPPHPHVRGNSVERDPPLPRPLSTTSNTSGWTTSRSRTPSSHRHALLNAALTASAASRRAPRVDAAPGFPTPVALDCLVRHGSCPLDAAPARKATTHTFIPRSSRLLHRARTSVIPVRARLLLVDARSSLAQARRVPTLVAHTCCITPAHSSRTQSCRACISPLIRIHRAQKLAAPTSSRTHARRGPRPIPIARTCRRPHRSRTLLQSRRTLAYRPTDVPLVADQISRRCRCSTSTQTRRKHPRCASKPVSCTITRLQPRRTHAHAHSSLAYSRYHASESSTPRSPAPPTPGLPAHLQRSLKHVRCGALPGLEPWRVVVGC
ncbi:hypothetical protein K438DRAFT_1780160 [Mycena galopus ATCC 62051]|nr:hypothetical protein K438DRAFT_1780160 [Mycena galopus ATCC 62051]